MKQLQVLSDTGISTKRESVTITFESSGRGKEVVCELLRMVRALGGFGASRMMGVVDEDMTNERAWHGEGPNDYSYPFKHAFVDGDGCDKLFDVKVNGEPL